MENQITYTLLLFEQGGYAIVSKENGYISEYNLLKESPYSEHLSESLYYGGPYSYYYKNSQNQMIDLLSNEIISLDITNDYTEQNEEFLNKKSEYNPRLRTIAWTGISESNFMRFSGWINNDNTCGSWSTAVMLAYYNDFIDDSILPDSIYKKNSATSNPKLLHNLLVENTEKIYGTLPYDLAGGVNTVLAEYGNSSYVCNYSLFGTWDLVVDACSRRRPICVGLSSHSGNKYGNHWVTVYQYMENSSGKGYYKCVDNWGATAATIETSWTIGTAKLNK